MKVQVNIDATKIDKKLMKDGKYLSLEVIPLKEPKQKAKPDGTFIQGSDWRLMKTHFVVQSNKDKEVKMPIIGEGVVFEKITDPSMDEPMMTESINPEEIPF